MLWLWVRGVGFWVKVRGQCTPPRVRVRVKTQTPDESNQLTSSGRRRNVTFPSGLCLFVHTRTLILVGTSSILTEPGTDAVETGLRHLWSEKELMTALSKYKKREDE